MWYLTGDTQELPNTQFGSQDEALVMLRVQGFEQIDGGENWTIYQYENFDGYPVVVVLHHDTSSRNKIDEFWLCVNKDGTGHIGIYRTNMGKTVYSSVRKLSVAKCAYFQIIFNRMLREQTIRVHGIQIDDGWTKIRYFPVEA